MSNYLQFLTAPVPVTQPLDARQVENHTGGFVFQISPWERLQRWLILGSEGNTYYQSAKALTLENAKTVVECLKLDAPRTVGIIVEISKAGRAPKNDPAVLALALAASSDSPETRKAALAALPEVCRIGTHLFQFVEACDKLRGWGRGLQNGLAAWYEGKTPEHLAQQVLKYQSRNGWSHRDVLRLAHLSPSEERQAIYRWVVANDKQLGVRDVKRGDGVVNYPPVGELPPLLAAYEELKKRAELGAGAEDIKAVLDLIRTHKMTHEMIPGELKARTDVWEAMLDHMPLGALVRNLAQLTAKGVIAPLTPRALEVAKRLTDKEAIHKARLHPVAFLSALRVYAQGHGEKGKLTWRAVPAISQALESGFYEAFKSVEPTGKSYLFGIDVSGSMQSGETGVPGVTPREAAAVMAMVIARREPSYLFLGFCHKLVDLHITTSTSLNDAIAACYKADFGSTNVALINEFAFANKLPVDVVVTITDNEVNAGQHPAAALKKLRAQRGAVVKNAVIACTPTEFSIADPNDVHSMDFVGFDSAAPAILADFVKAGV